MKPTPKRRINMLSAFNFRDLGGYSTKNGSTTKFGVFFRSDLLTVFDPKDYANIEPYNISIAIDLRDESEISREISKFGEMPGVKILEIPLFEQFKKDLGVIKLDESFQKKANITSLGDLYISVAKHCAKDFAKIFEILATNEGATLFHCTAGKDRTGMVSALLLDLMGVYHKDIVCDYQISQTLIQEKFETGFQNHKSFQKQTSINALGSDPFNIEMFLNYIQNGFSTSQNYLLQAGLSQNNIEVIKNKFLDR